MRGVRAKARLYEVGSFTLKAFHSELLIYKKTAVA